MAESFNNHQMLTRDSVEAEIQSTKNAMEALRTKLYHLHEMLNLTSPMLSKLPTETITEIFIIAVDSHSNFQQFTLGHVCRTWRELVWKNPRLWRNIIIRFPCHDRGSGEHLEWVNECMARSGKQLLDLDMSIYNEDSEFDPREEFFELLLSVSERWNSLKLIGYPFINFRRVMSERQSQFPRLTKIHIVGSDNELAWKFGNTPSLRNVMVFDGFQLVSIEIGWSRLNEMWAALSLEGCLAKMQAASQTLTTCNIDLRGMLRGVLKRTEAIHLPHLNDLRLTNTFHQIDDKLVSVLANIEAPLLTSLYIRTDKHTDESLPSDLLILVQRSKCLITNLTLTHLSSKDDRLTHMLQHLPSLVKLTIVSLPPRDHFSPILGDCLNPSRHSSTQLCLPNLTHLSYYGQITFDFAQLLDGLTARMQDKTGTIRKMETLDIHYPNAEWLQRRNPNDTLNFHRALSRLETAFGIDIQFTWGGQFGHRLTTTEEDFLSNFNPVT